MNNTRSSKLFYNNERTGALPCGPVFKNAPSNAGDVGSIPGWGTKIPLATMTEVHTPPREKPTCSNKDPMQPGKKNHNEIPPHTSQNGHH